MYRKLLLDHPSRFLEEPLLLVYQEQPEVKRYIGMNKMGRETFFRRSDSLGGMGGGQFLRTNCERKESPDLSEDEIFNRSRIGVEGMGGRSLCSLICSEIRLSRSFFD